MGAIDALTRDRIPDWISGSEGVVFVDVWGPKCAPCLALGPTYEALADQFDDRGRFLKLEAPANRMACVDLGVMGMPTFLAFRNGSEVGRLSGESINQAELEAWVVGKLNDTNEQGEN
jgi:thiol-disulfide isomerase/thioredoxin